MNNNWKETFVDRMGLIVVLSGQQRLEKLAALKSDIDKLSPKEQQEVRECLRMRFTPSNGEDGCDSAMNALNSVAPKSIPEFLIYRAARQPRLFLIWTGMKQRCYDSKCIAFRYYGAKGITICREWLTDFREFAKWALDHGYQDELTIDRILSTGDYEPFNCRWISRSDNSRRVKRVKQSTR